MFKLISSKDEKDPEYEACVGLQMINDDSLVLRRDCTRHADPEVVFKDFDTWYLAEKTRYFKYRESGRVFIIDRESVVWVVYDVVEKKL